MNSITKRWVRGSLFFTLAVLLVAEVLFLYFMVQGYYNSVRSDMDSKLATLRGQLTIASTATNQTKEMQLRRVVEQFDAKNKFELMLVNENGDIVSTSSGFSSPYNQVPPDVMKILQADGGDREEYVGANDPGGERVMAVTVKAPYSSGGVVAIRLVTSLTLVNKAIRTMVFVSIGFLLVVVLASIVSGTYFIRSIVMPLQKVEATASLIAEGDFETRIDIKTDDEIGSLCKTINYMAEELSRSEKMKNDFISSVSHELRTPLTSIKGWTETVGNISNPDDPSFRRGVEIIAGETDRLYDMVEELLDFSRMQNGLQLEKERLDLAAEVEEAVLLSTQRAGLLGLTLEFEAPELPIPVMADKNRIRQVLINILDNAIKYSLAGESIEVEILSEGLNAYVVVTDHGAGIDVEDLENIKLRFYKGKGAVRGSGIGLAVVDEIMKAHDGSLEITSERRKGTQVTLRFPLHQFVKNGG